jgi:hypothetical protein
MPAFEGKKGHSGKPADPPQDSDHKVIPHDNFIQLAERWLTSVYGTSSLAAWERAFPGEAGSDCGCDPNLAQATATGLIDIPFIVTQSCPIENKEPVYSPRVIVKMGPRMVTTGGVSGKFVLAAGTDPLSAVSESDPNTKLPPTACACAPSDCLCPSRSAWHRRVERNRGRRRARFCAPTIASLLLHRNAAKRELKPTPAPPACLADPPCRSHSIDTATASAEPRRRLGQR